MAKKKADSSIQAKERNRRFYTLFRREIDRYCIPLVLNISEMTPIFHEGRQVGFLSVVGDYLDGLFVLPEYRRMGLGKKAVLEWIEAHGMPRTLHIVNSNLGAKRFWEALFELAVVDENEVDTLYRIVALRR